MKKQICLAVLVMAGGMPCLYAQVEAAALTPLLTSNFGAQIGHFVRSN
jgi:hypothetical protein